jgi:FdhD protein
MDDNAIKHIPVIKVTDIESRDTTDMLAVEEPLEIRLKYLENGEPVIKNVSVTMRTPGNDAELATGFLFTEGIIKGQQDIAAAGHVFIACSEDKQNTIQVELCEGVTPSLYQADRNFYTTSSCGVCGKGSISAIKTVSPYSQKGPCFTAEAEVLFGLPEVLRYYQTAFASTGGIHAAALFNKKGELLTIREDVGRHNALDKLVGAAMREDKLPLYNTILLLSGRASFELIQKAAMAGICTIAAVGAPSSLAVELAEEFNITLAGFLRGRRFNIYSGPNRIILPANEVTY